MRLNQVTENTALDLDDARIYATMRIKPEQFTPVLSSENVDLHFNTLTKGYFKRWNNERSNFAFCGAILHSIWWNNLDVNATVTPSIQSTFDVIGLDCDAITTKFVDLAASLEGNGWVYLDRSCECRVIKNHDYVGNFNDILLLIDLWEHSYIHDYKADKETYIRRIMTIVDWKEVGRRVSNPAYTEKVLRIATR